MSPYLSPTRAARVPVRGAGGSVRGMHGMLGYGWLTDGKSETPASQFTCRSQSASFRVVGHPEEIHAQHWASLSVPRETSGLYRDCPETGCRWGAPVVGQLRGLR